MKNIKNLLFYLSAATLLTTLSFAKQPPAGTGNLTVMVKHIRNSTYAAAAFHDENSDKKVNSNFIGIPKEGIGVSNNVKGRFGPLKFDDAKFTFSQPTQTITISLTYL
jgi:uncharacterized protein (DUF2141 family)